MSKISEKVIRVAMRNGDDTKVKVEFHGGAFTPAEFTSLFMAVLETYTSGLLTTNSREQVFNYWNDTFGIFLNKIVTVKEHYKLSKQHKKFKKEVVDKTLGQDIDEKDTEDNRFAAYLLCREILTKEAGMTEETVDLLLAQKLKLAEPDLEKINGKKE